MPRVKRTKSVEPIKKPEGKGSKIQRSVSVKVKVTEVPSARGRKMREIPIPMEIDEAPKRATKRGKPVQLKDVNTTEKRRKPDLKLNETEIDEELLSSDIEDISEEVQNSDSNNNKRASKKIKGAILPKHNRGIGRPMVCGMGDTGQLGFEAERRKHPAFVPFFDEKNINVIEVAAGGMHTIVLTDTGHVYGFGCNDDLALGRVTEDEEECFTPERVNVPGTVIQISAGDSHSAALTEEGAVYAWGQFRDQNGPIGLVYGPKEPKSIPQLLSKNLPSKIIKIASGSHHLALLGEDGVVYTLGCGEQGQLGRTYNPATRITRANPIAPQDAREFWLTPQPIVLKARVKFNDIFCGSYSLYCKTLRSNDIHVCGLNNYNQLGIQRRGNEEEHLVVTKVTKSPGFLGCRYKEIAAGEHHCVALSIDGKVYSLGRQEDGRLGLGDSVTDVHMPTLIPGLEDKTCVHVACGLSQGYAVTDNGRLYSWGFGENCQLGNGTDQDSNVPRLCEGSAVLSLRDINILYVSGGGQHTTLIGVRTAPTTSTDEKPKPKPDQSKK